MFAKKSLHSKFKDPATTAHQRACSMGRIVSVCRMMDSLETKSQLYHTLSNLDSVM